MRTSGFFVAATGQNVGKTTTCLGLVFGLKKRHATVGFMKPVGQEHVEIEPGLLVDKDVILFKSHFHLPHSYQDMSPVLFPRGFTRDYLDGKVCHKELIQRIITSHQRITNDSEITVIEGTGHTAVGSIVHLNNAQIAKLLNVNVILIAQGGLGSSFDEIALNYAMCEQHGVKIIGVILNRVLEEKRSMIQAYMSSALKRWNIPLLGCIPFNSFLSACTMQDFEQLFGTTLITGQEHRMRHFQHIRLAAGTSLDIYRPLLVPHQLIVTPSGREDIILATLTHYWDAKLTHPEEEQEIGLILTGKYPPKPSIIEQIRKANIPMLYAPMSSYHTLKLINHFTSKIRKEDTAKVHEAIGLVEQYVDFKQLLDLLRKQEVR